MIYLLNLLRDGWAFDTYRLYKSGPPIVNMTSPGGSYVSVQMLPGHPSWHAWR